MWTMNELLNQLCLRFKKFIHKIFNKLKGTLALFTLFYLVEHK